MASIDTTIVITNFNNQDYIGRAIRSCLKQSAPHDSYEIIVVDDCSTDNSREVITSFGEQVKAVFLPQNGGVAHASNEGIRNAMGRFIIRVDSDDYVSEHTVLFLREILNANPDIGFVYTDHLKVDKEERVIERTVINTLELLLRHGAGIMMRKSYLEALGLYNPELRNAEDYDLLKRYLLNYNGYHLRLPLYRYRQLETSITHTMDRKEWEQKADAHS